MCTTRVWKIHLMCERLPAFERCPKSNFFFVRPLVGQIPLPEMSFLPLRLIHSTRRSSQRSVVSLCLKSRYRAQSSLVQFFNEIPSLPSQQSSSPRSAQISSHAPHGLLGMRSVQNPTDFPRIAHETIQRCERHIALMTSGVDPSLPSSSSSSSGLVPDDAGRQASRQRSHPARSSPPTVPYLIKQMDTLSDMICVVIDLAELIRHVHPSQSWVDAANEAYAILGRYIHQLNTNVKLYEVSLHMMV